MINGKELGAYAAQKDMAITTIGTGLAYAWDGYSLTHPCSTGGKKPSMWLRVSLEWVPRWGGADVMLAIMKGLFPDGADREEYKNMFYESLLPCVELAEKLGNDLTIEAVNRSSAPISGRRTRRWSSSAASAPTA